MWTWPNLGVVRPVRPPWLRACYLLIASPTHYTATPPRHPGLVAGICINFSWKSNCLSAVKVCRSVPEKEDEFLSRLSVFQLVLGVKHSIATLTKIFSLLHFLDEVLVRRTCNQDVKNVFTFFYLCHVFYVF